MENIFSVLIIGAGNIGAFYDTPSSENILTHAHAFTKVEGFKLLGFVDIDYERAVKAAELWDLNAFAGIEEAFYKHNIDVVCVCVPDNFHYDVMKKLSDFQIKLLFVEKPLAKTLEQAKEIIELYNDNYINCLVNYSRRFVPEFESIRGKISTGEYGKFICGNGYYGKGTLHNGSHLIDILRYFIGDISETKTFNYNYDFYKDDPSVSAIIKFKDGGLFTMLNVPCENFTIFELELLFENARVKIVNSGFDLEIYKVGDSEVYNGYRNLVKNSECKTSLGSALESAARNIYNHLAHNEELKCTLKDAYEAMVICEKLKEGAWTK